MKLDAKTLMVMKNFSSINPSLLFKPGNVISTVSPTKSVLAKARLDQSFEKQFAIYDLSRFIGVMSLFDDPTLDFRDNAVTILSGSRELTYRYADVSAIIAPKDGNVELPSVDVTFSMTAPILQDIQKALGALGMPEIAIVGDRERMWLQVTDSKNPTADSYKIFVGNTDKKFHMVFKAENLKLIPQDYSVEITSKGLSHFKGSQVVDVDYWIALEAKASKFEN